MRPQVVFLCRRRRQVPHCDTVSVGVVALAPSPDGRRSPGAPGPAWCEPDTLHLQSPWLSHSRPRISPCVSRKDAETQRILNIFAPWLLGANLIMLFTCCLPHSSRGVNLIRCIYNLPGCLILVHG